VSVSKAEGRNCRAAHTHTGNAQSFAGTHTSVTVILVLVSVPLLSVQMTDVWQAFLPGELFNQYAALGQALDGIASESVTVGNNPRGQRDDMMQCKMNAWIGCRPTSVMRR